MFNFIKKNSELKEEIKRLNERLTEARADRNAVELAVTRLQTDHIVELERRENSHKIIVNRIQNEYNALEKSVPLKVAKEVAQEKKDLIIKGEKQDKEHADRMKALEANYAAKIAKCDRDLETDKANYKKYIRSEFNSKLETLEKENAKLSEEAVTLRAENSSLWGTNDALKYINTSLNDSVSELSKGMVSLSGKIGEGLVKALPTVGAEFETPILPENHVHFELPGQKGGNTGGQEKKN